MLSLFCGGGGCLLWLLPSLSPSFRVGLLAEIIRVVRSRADLDQWVPCEPLLECACCGGLACCVSSPSHCLHSALPAVRAPVAHQLFPHVRCGDGPLRSV